MTNPLGVKDNGDIVWPNGPYAEWWDKLAWGHYGYLGWGSPLLLQGQIIGHFIPENML